MLTIGEFSKLSHISSRMLRYYDAMGLLRPHHTGQENGYRYYDEVQLQTLFKIESLKGYGFTLAEIQELISLSQEKLAVRIHSRRIKAYEELHELRKKLRLMEDELLNMEGMNMVQEKYNVIIMDTPPQRVFGMRRKISIAEAQNMFSDLLDEMNKSGLKRAGSTQLLYHGEEFSYEDMDVEAQVQVSGEHEGVKEIPGELCVATTHIGPYETIKYAYDAISAWMANHPEYKICGPVIERYLKDMDSVSSAEELETGVLFPVKKMK